MRQGRQVLEAHADKERLGEARHRRRSRFHQQRDDDLLPALARSNKSAPVVSYSFLREEVVYDIT